MAYRDITSSIRNYASAQADTNENLYEEPEPGKVLTMRERQERNT